MNEILKKIQKKRIEQLPYRKIHPYMADVNDAYNQGFEDGAEFALKNQWITIDEALPEEDPDCNKWPVPRKRKILVRKSTSQSRRLDAGAGNGGIEMKPKKIEKNCWEYGGFTILKSDCFMDFPFIVYDSEGFSLEALNSLEEAVKYIDSLKMNNKERKIGEIFEYKGERYQCVEGYHCYDCDFRHENGTCIIDANYPESKMGNCNGDYRPDNQNVVFKKLEKVGEPFTIVGKLYQYYKVLDIDNVCGDGFWCVHNYKAKTLTIEIKQNKEDMEEKKQKLDKLVDDYMACRIQYAEFDKEIKALYDKEESEPNLKEFDIEAALSGKPVCTRTGRKARIICFDRNHQYPVVALIECKDGEEMIAAFTKDGKTDYEPKNNDLMMLTEKKERWINVYNSLGVITFSHNTYDTKEEALEALKSASGKKYYVDTIKISWEE